MTKTIKRKPIYGLLGPKGLKKHLVDPPIENDERPVVVARTPREVIVHQLNKDKIAVENQTEQICPYMVVIVPDTIVSILNKDRWDEIIALLRRYSIL